MEHRLVDIARNFRLDKYMLFYFVKENKTKYGININHLTTTTFHTDELVKAFKLYLRNAPIREYKLIQTYPGSPKKGFLIKRVIKKTDYYFEKTEDDDYTFSAYKGHIERQTKFWKRIK